MGKLLKKLGISRKRHTQRDLATSFRENQHLEEAYDSRDRGRRQVPLDQIVGSVGRYRDFDNKFRPKQHLPPERLQTIKNLIRQGKPLPPVKLYQIKDRYFVLDGNHRIAAAKEFGWRDIDANILEFIPSRNTLENVLYREKAEFEDKTRLPETIKLTEIGQYAYLLKQISEHKDFLRQESGQSVQFTQAARDWYQTIYRPLATIIKQGGLIASFPERTLADLYAYIAFHQWEIGRKRKYGIGIDRLIPKNMEEFRKKMSDKKENDYPEMKRDLTAYVLMNIQGKSELKVMEKLFTLREVQEVHTLHGAFDVIAKIVLTRDLLSSDAEIIGQFVHDNIRQVPGVNSTQTLIPAFSKVKQQTAE
jgi:hypothetical protein